MKIKDAPNLITKTSTSELRSTEVGVDPMEVKKLKLILTTSLYSNPIGSIVREYTSNCFDAHIEAGNTEDPVIVQIDTNEAKFIDFGIGLNEKEFENVFCRMLKSTKEHTNEYIGAFGLGSKSAFAYTDSFMVKSVKEGIERIWVLNKHNYSKIIADKISEKPSTDKTGTCVTVPIADYSDYLRFNREAEAQLKYFDNVFFDCEVSNDYKIYRTEDFVLSSKVNTREPMHICLGKVSYKIDWSFLDIAPIYIPIGLRFDIGELSVTPSRENIAWDEQSKELVLKKIEKVTQWLIDKYEKEGQKYEDIIAYIKAADEPAKLKLNGVNLLINELPHAKVEKAKYVGKKPFIANPSREIYSLFRKAYAPIGYHNIKFTTDNITSIGAIRRRKNFRFITRYRSKSCKYIMERDGLDYVFILVEEQWVEPLRGIIEEKYGGYVCEEKIPKTSRYYNKRKRKSSNDEIVGAFGEYYEPNADFCKFVKENIKLKDIDNWEGLYFYGTKDERTDLAAATLLGFKTIMLAKSNFKHLQNTPDLKFKHVSEMEKTNRAESLAKNYRTAKIVSKEIPHIIANLEFLSDIVDENQHSYLKELKSICEKVEEETIVTNSHVRRLLDLLEEAVDPKTPLNLGKAISELKHLECIKFLDGCYACKNKLDIVKSSSLLNERYDSEQKKQFIKEYHELKLMYNKNN